MALLQKRTPCCGHSWLAALPPSALARAGGSSSAAAAAVRRRLRVRGGGACRATADQAAALRDWVLEHSQTLPTELLPMPRPGRGGAGLSMVTQEPVARGQVLVRVPIKLLMTFRTACDSPLCGPVAAQLTEWQALTLHLLAERAAGSDSFWAPYLALLPPSQADHPLLWGPDRLEWLKARRARRPPPPPLDRRCHPDATRQLARRSAAMPGPPDTP